MIASDGTIYEGRSLRYEAAHVLGKNSGNIGIAFLGEYSKKALSGAQIESARALIKELNFVFNIPSRNANGENYIFTHGQFDRAKESELAGANTQIEALRKSIYGR